MTNLFRRAIFLFDHFMPSAIVRLRIEIFRKTRNIFWEKSKIETGIKNFVSGNGHIFFGYYDTTPFSKDGMKILAMRTPIINRAPGIEDKAEVGYFKIDEKTFVAIGETNTWCWQQGCRLQWFPQVEGNKIFYNCLVNGKYGSVVKDLSGNVVKEFNKPFYSISRDGRWGLSLDFSRLQRLRPGYGYSILPEKTVNNLAPLNGIELVNLENNKTSQIISLAKVTKIKPHPSMEGAQHYFNHIMFNPSGEKFLFFHLWMDPKGRRYSRLFVANKNGSIVKLINNDGSVSHYNWISKDKIILYSYIKKVGKSVYAIFNSLDKSIEYLGNKIPKIDGHPTFLSDKKSFVTDTYPDLCGQRNLLLYSIEKNTTRVLMRFDESEKFSGEFRCDLHPRISRDERKICVDRILNGKRVISIIPLAE